RKSLQCKVRSEGSWGGDKMPARFASSFTSPPQLLHDRPRARKPNSHQLMQLLATTRALRPFVSLIALLAIVSSFALSAAPFTIAGGSAAKYIARWSGSSWSPLGSGINDPVFALAVSGSDLYAAVGGGLTNYVAKWDGSIWSVLGSGMNARVSSLAVSGSNLY